MKKQVLALVFLSTLSLQVYVKADTDVGKVGTDKTAQIKKSDEKPKQEISSEKIHVQKVVTEKGKTLAGGKEISRLVGVNGASFKVYDMTELFDKTLDYYVKLEEKKTDLKDKLTTDDKNESKSNQDKLDEIAKETITQNKFLDELTQKAKKLDLNKLKVFAQGNTKTTGDKDGIFEFTVPVLTGKYRAYWVVNDKVDDDKATLSESFVLITPVIDPETGLPLDTVFTYPKAQLIDKPQPEKEVPYPHTGIKADWLSKLVNLFN